MEIVLAFVMGRFVSVGPETAQRLKGKAKGFTDDPERHIYKSGV
jgi:hypothetical protein